MLTDNAKGQVRIRPNEQGNAICVVMLSGLFMGFWHDLTLFLVASIAKCELESENFLI